MFAMPLETMDSTIPVCDISHDMGLVVKAQFDLGHGANGKIYPLVSEYITVLSL